MSIQLLAQIDDDLPVPTSAVFLRCSNGHSVDLLPLSTAEALLKLVTATPLVDVTGDLTRGFAWSVTGAHPRRSYAVSPLPAPAWPFTTCPTAVTVELWWQADQDGYRHVRSFEVWAEDPHSAYLIACCLWSTAATGAGAEAAFLYGPDRRIAYRINAAAWTCSHIPATTIKRAVATVTDRDTTDPLPDDMRTSAMHEERVDGILTYTGTRKEIAELLRKHAEDRDASADYFAAAEMRQAAGDIERGMRSDYVKAAAYRLDDQDNSQQHTAEASPGTP
jgi:hypothetical protein